MDPAPDVRQAVQTIMADLLKKAQNAARRNKPTMWGYYLESLLPEGPAGRRLPGEAAEPEVDA